VRLVTEIKGQCRDVNKLEFQCHAYSSPAFGIPEQKRVTWFSVNPLFFILRALVNGLEKVIRPVAVMTHMTERYC